MATVPVIEAAGGIVSDWEGNNISSSSETEFSFYKDPSWPFDSKHIRVIKTVNKKDKNRTMESYR